MAAKETPPDLGPLLGEPKRPSANDAYLAAKSERAAKAKSVLDPVPQKFNDADYLKDKLARHQAWLKAAGKI